jgi:hypothetical protein
MILSFLGEMNLIDIHKTLSANWLTNHSTGPAQKTAQAGEFKR